MTFRSLATRFLSAFCIFGFLIGGAAWSNDPWNVTVPLPPSSANQLSKNPACGSADAANPESYFGFSFGTYFDAGAAVASVDETGPSQGLVRIGDVIVSINGLELVEDRDFLAGSGGQIIRDPFGRMQLNRGIYIYGIRDGAPFETIVWSCDGPPKTSPFRAQKTIYNLDALYPEADHPYEIGQTDPRLILAAFSWAKSAHYSHRTKLNKYALTDHEYCTLKPSTRINYKSHETSRRFSFGMVVDERSNTFDRSITVDVALASAYRQHFDFIHNEARKEVDFVKYKINRVLETFGCASPEFKDFERRVYALFGM